LATSVDLGERGDSGTPPGAVDAARESSGPGRAICLSRGGSLVPIVALACIYAALHGAIAVGIPWYEPTIHNDDWAYAAPVRTLCDEGRFQLHRLTGPLALPQILAGWALCELAGGFSFSLLRTMMVVHGIVPAVLLWYLLRALGFPRRLAWCGCLLFLVNPIVVSLAWSFQTDLVYLSFTLSAVIGILVADRDGKPQTLVLAVLMLLLGCLTRQNGIFVAAGGAAYLGFRRRWSWAMLTALVIPLTMAAEKWLVFQSSLTYLPLAGEHVRQALADLSPGRLFHGAYETLHVLLFLGLALCPLLLLSGVTRQGYRGVAAVLTAAVLLGGVFLLDAPKKRGVLLGNYLYIGERWGIGPATLEISNADPIGVAAGGEDKPAVRILNLVGYVSGCLLLGTLAFTLARLWGALRHWRAEPLTLVELTFCLALAGTVCSSALIGHVLVDRYVILLCPLAIPLCFRPDASPRRLMTAVLPVCVLSAWVAWAGAVDYWRWNGARWAAAAWLESQGVSPERIDGGYEYNALHDTLGLPPEIMRAADRNRRAEILEACEGRDTYCLRFRPEPSEQVLAKVPYDSPTMGAAAVYVSRHRAAKPTVPSVPRPVSADRPPETVRSRRP